MVGWSKMGTETYVSFICSYLFENEEICYVIVVSFEYIEWVKV